MNRVVEILMRRDKLTKTEAEKQVSECKEMLLRELDEDIIMDFLGLEPDYLMDILEF